MPTLTQPAAFTAEDLRTELARLRREFNTRVSALEQQLAALGAPTTPPEPATAEPSPQVSPETVVIIAAAVTAFLGKKVKIRQVHQLDSGTTPWAQQGRAIIQASHNLSR